MSEARKPTKPDRAAVISKDPTVGIGLALEDPTQSGGRLRIVSLAGAFDEARDLPGDGWTIERRGYKFRDAAGTRVVLRIGKRLKLAMRGDDFTLAAGLPTPVVVTLTVGDRRLCLEFADGELRSKGRRLIAKDAPPPAVCNEPPAP